MLPIADAREEVDPMSLADKSCGMSARDALHYDGALANVGNARETTCPAIERGVTT